MTASPGSSSPAVGPAAPYCVPWPPWTLPHGRPRSPSRSPPSTGRRFTSSSATSVSSRSGRPAQWPATTAWLTPSCWNMSASRHSMCTGWRHPPTRIPRDGPELDTAASDYATVLGEYAPEGFDLHLLGMGPEGHINSRFPHTPELSPADGTTVVAGGGCPKPPAERVSLTGGGELRPAGRGCWCVELQKRTPPTMWSAANDPAQWPAAAVRGTSETVLHVDAGPILARNPSPTCAKGPARSPGPSAVPRYSYRAVRTGSY